jgi:hypothetical protein
MSSAMVRVLPAILLVVLIAGCSGGASPGSKVPDVSMSATDANPDQSTIHLDVTWNARAQRAVDPNPDDISKFPANDGQKFLVVRMRIRNTGSSDVELDPRLFRLQSNGVKYDYQGLFGSGNGLVGVTLTPDAEYTAWTSFTIPNESTSATLIVDQEAYFQKNASVEFTHDPQLPINMSA